MKRYQSGAEKRKKNKRIQETIDNQRNDMLKYLIVEKDEQEQEPSTSSVVVVNKYENEVNQNVTSNIKKGDNPSPKTIVTEPCLNADIALWPTVLSDEMINDIILNKPKNIGNMESLKSVYKERDQCYYRGLSENHFFRIKSNGIKEQRNWLVFSETSKCVYCYPCKMFSKSTSKLITGFQNWKTITTTLSEHENSKEHMSSICIFYKRSSVSNRIDSKLIQQREQEVNYWQEVLKRIISTIKLISKLGLAFRGHDESKSSDRKGNYLSCLEYLSEYDDFLKLHLEKYGNRGRGNTNYLSHQICNEFISIITEHVTTFIVEEIKSSTYYSLILDSTPDISHQDQLTLIIRYVLPNGEIKERFLGFIPIAEHTASYLEEQVLLILKKLEIDIKFCRGQSYDNAANMSGKYSGLQARIKNYSSNAVYIPCASHSLNLIGNFAAENCGPACQYFIFVQKLFTFFSSSTHRWNILCKELDKCGNNLTIKRVSDTRWSAKADAVLALKIGYNNIKTALHEISNSNFEKQITVVEAKSLLKKMNKYNTGLMTIIWNNILQRVNATSKSLQSVECTVLRGSNLLKSLQNFITKFREEFNNVQKEATDLTSSSFEEQEETDRPRKKCNDSNALSKRENFIFNCFYVICDNMIAELARRNKIYEDTIENFKIFFDLNLNNTEQKKLSQNLKTTYKNDIDVLYFDDELEQFIVFLQEDTDKYNNAISIYQAANEMSSTFPNIEIILKIFLTLPISNASGERSFSALKRVKNYLRNTMTDDRLNSMSLLYIEQEVMNKIDTTKIINDFARRKSRKMFI